jgi:uridine phosphorylase
MSASIDTTKASHPNQGPFSPSDLPMDKKGVIYHLAISRGQIARDILIVGDPDRVPLITNENFSSIESDTFHRGLRTITGEVKNSGHRVTVLTSGMGTPSLEIVFNELMALNEIDPATRMRINQVEPLNIIRVGTSGLLQNESTLGTSILTSFAIGLDNTGLFYNVLPQDEVCTQIENSVKEMLDEVIDPKARFYGKIFPYAAKADPELLACLVESAQKLGAPYEVGITASSSGFNANQGRDVSRIPLTVPDIDLHLSKLDLGLAGGQRILNMEMEASHLLHFASAHGYRGATVCVGIANRRQDTFAANAQEAVYNATAIALSALERIRKR